MIGDEVEIVHIRHVSCDGGSDGGHPKVYLEIGMTDEVECPYCGKTFILKKEGS